MAEFSDAHLAIIDARIQNGINAQIANTSVAIKNAVDALNVDLTTRVASEIAESNKYASSVAASFNDHLDKMKEFADKAASSSAAIEKQLADGLENLRAKGQEFGDLNKVTLDAMDAKIVEQRSALEKVHEDRKAATDDLNVSLASQKQLVEQAVRDCSSVKSDIGQYVAKKEADMQDILKQKEVELNAVAANIRQTLVKESGAKGFTIDGVKKSGLVDVKETGVGKLANNVTTGEFINWRTNLDLHLENFEGYAGFGELLKKVRLHDEENISLEKVDQMAHEVDEKREKDGLEKFFNKTFVTDARARGEEIFKYIHPKLNVSLTAAATRVLAKNGFELYRLISQKFDPKNKTKPMQILKSLRLMTGDRCKNLLETRAMIDRLDNVKREYEDKLGEEIDDSELVLVLWATMDEKTHEKVSNSGMT